MSTNLLEFILFGFLVLFALSLCVGPEWTFDRIDWTKKSCGKSKQSPIDIKETEAIRDEAAKVEIDWKRVHMKLKSVTINTGYTVEFRAKKMAANVRMGDVTYQIHKILYHWSNDQAKGSEHSLDGKFFFGEAQFVHYNTKYTNFKEAKTKPDGLLIVAIFLQEDEALEKDVPALEGFKKILPEVIEPNSRKELIINSKSVSTEDMLPEERDYFRYKGSLTEPPCTENVEWVVFKTPLKVTESYMKLLRDLKSSETETIQSNVRPTQPLNGRTVYKYINRL